MTTGVGCHFLLQEIFPTHGLNAHLLLGGEFFTTEPQGGLCKIAICKIACGALLYSTGSSAQVSEMIYRGRMRAVGGRGYRYIIHMAGSLCCTAEANTTL